MSAAPATHRGIIAALLLTQTLVQILIQILASRLPLLIATALALLLHLAAALGLAALDRPPPRDTTGDETASGPLRFDLLPRTTPASEPLSKEPVASEESPLEQPAELSEELVAAKAQSETTETSNNPNPLQGQLQDQLQDKGQNQDGKQKPEAPLATDSSPSARDPLAPALDSLSAPPASQISAADIFASRDQALASLTQPRQPIPGGPSQSRRKAINASTQEYVYANYLESWRRKVERIGNLNYPEEAKEKRLFGSLVLQVAVRADGSLEGVRLLRSSGHQVLDQAAVRIVELAAPFAPFPDSIRARHDVLDITRTWQFLREQKLGWDK
ncbi:hypothetical protein Thiowin_04874 [Thiorhodovibrio winogradskyi]|uniref:TonB C-terminal domain-containing protein n=1 Tax=Thiorhodovibrio winogradskyi TaxID=77007 RepID=A0ABZ0SF98_9GAMM|nr:TonB family protein [Thiorhodovibrio winogradskyi]